MMPDDLLHAIGTYTIFLVKCISDEIANVCLFTVGQHNRITMRKQVQCLNVDGRMRCRVNT
jgi:hypothetical protein